MQDFIDGFVAAEACDQIEFGESVFFERLDEGAGGGWIVGSVDDEGVDLLVASGPDDVGEAELGGRLGAGLAEENLERGESGLSILAIECAAEGECGWEFGKGSEVGRVVEGCVSFASDRGNSFAHA